MEIAYKENKKGYKVLTPDGYKSFAGIRCLGKKPIYQIELENGYWIECTNNHKVFVDNSCRVEISDINIGDTILCNVGNLKLLSKINLNREELVYDLIEVDGGHRYYTNGILSSNCEFIIFDETLIAPILLSQLCGVDPIEKQGQIRWYKKPEKDKTYVVALDPSLGTGSDPAAIQVFEMPGLKQVAEWSHNKTIVQRQIVIMKEICGYLAETAGQNNVYYSVENNTLGEAALVAISEIGEESIHGIFLSEPKRAGIVSRSRKGFTTTNKSKLSACSKFKSLVETKRLIIASKALISELKTFVASGGSYAAKIGEHDDLVMASLLAIRMIQQLQMYDSTVDSELRDTIDNFTEPLPFICI